RLLTVDDAENSRSSITSVKKNLGVIQQWGNIDLPVHAISKCWVWHELVLININQSYQSWLLPAV
ncbi:MAG: hypothetical protein KAT65_22435, partial [Methanophagales archaeon]|nr:hypothetical protein [Methanophagales archaeon]